MYEGVSHKGAALTVFSLVFCRFDKVNAIPAKQSASRKMLEQEEKTWESKESNLCRLCSRRTLRLFSLRGGFHSYVEHFSKISQKDGSHTAQDIQKTAVTKELAIQGSSVDSAKTVLAKWIWESRYEEVERAYSLVTAVRFLNAKNGADYKFSLHFLTGLCYTAYGISAMQFQPFVCN